MIDKTHQINCVFHQVIEFLANPCMTKLSQIDFGQDHRVNEKKIVESGAVIEFICEVSVLNSVEVSIHAKSLPGPNIVWQYVLASANVFI